MPDLNTVPATVRQHMEMADAINTHNQEGALALLNQTGQELVRTNPEMVGLLAAAQLGKKSITMTDTETKTKQNNFKEVRMGITTVREENTTIETRTSIKNFRIE